MKKLLLCISAGLVTALILVQAYCWFIYPEFQFYKKADAIRTLHEQKLRAAGHSCYILGGGSETKTSFSPRIMNEEAGIQVVNTALAAGFGLEANAAVAINHLQDGDTLVLGLLSTKGRNTLAADTGIKLNIQLFGLQAFRHGIIPLNFRNILAVLTSNASNMMVTLVRRLTRGYAFIYDKQSTLHPDSWMQVHRNAMQGKKIPSTIADDIIIQPECVSLLNRLQATCRALQADFVVMLPVGYTNEYETKRRLMHALQLTRMGIPVLRDERLGREPDSSLYADTMFHMNARGTDQNSRIIARLLKEKSYWTEHELLEQMKARGFTENSTPQK